MTRWGSGKARPPYILLCIGKCIVILQVKEKEDEKVSQKLTVFTTNGKKRKKTKGKKGVFL